MRLKNRKRPAARVRRAQGAPELCRMVGIVENHFRSVQRPRSFVSSLHSAKRCQRSARFSEVRSERDGKRDRERRVRRIMRARKRQSKSRRMRAVGECVRLPALPFENSRKRICAYGHTGTLFLPRVSARTAAVRRAFSAAEFAARCAAGFPYDRMRTRTYESVLGTDYRERTLFDKFRKNVVDFAGGGVTVGMVAFHISDDGDGGCERKQMTSEFARFRQKYAARQTSVLFAQYGQIAHSHGFAAYMRDERYAERFENMRRHRRHRGFPVRAAHRCDDGKPRRDFRQKLVALRHALSHSARGGQFRVAFGHRGRINDDARPRDYVPARSRINLCAERRKFFHILTEGSVAARHLRARKQAVFGKRAHTRAARTYEMHSFTVEFRHTELYAAIPARVPFPQFPSSAARICGSRRKPRATGRRKRFRPQKKRTRHAASFCLS